MLRPVLFFLCCLWSGCSMSIPQDKTESEEHSTPAAWKLRITKCLDDGTTRDSIEDILIASLVGNYYAGDHLGYNLFLKIKPDSTFECEWTGCLGSYQKTTGVYSTEANALIFKADKVEGMFETKPIDRMRVIVLQRHFLLLQESDGDWFKKHGPDTCFCFHKQDAEPALREEFNRKIERAMKKR